MNKKIVITLIIGLAVVVIAIALNNKNSALETGTVVNNEQVDVTNEIGQTAVENNVADEVAPVEPENKEAAIKEFTMTSFYDDTGIWFSLKEMSVNQGDNVRIKVTNIKGTHDFTLDEYGIKKMTPLNEEVVIEFTADKVGEFIYYCSVPGHRQKGQWGTLEVLDNQSI